MDENKILNTIKSSGIKPISKGYFKLKRYATLSLGIVVTILGALVFAKIVAQLLISDWEHWDYVFNTFRGFLYFSMPILWICLLVAFIFFTPFILEKTGNGYKYKRIILVLFSILTSIILGLIILKVGAYTGINRFFTTSAEKVEAKIWMRPNDGRIAGEITVRGNESVILRDLKNNLWAVDVSNILPVSKSIIQENENVRILGLKLDENTFLACQVLPFESVPSEGFEYDEKPLEIRPKEKTVTAKDVCSVVLRQGL